MDVVQWLLFGALPAVAAVLLLVGVGGPRWLALALALAVCVPLALEDGVPPWPWQLDLVHGPPRPALWWLLLLAGAFGAAFDLRALPAAIAVPAEVVLCAALPWLLSSPLRAGWSFEAAVLLLGLGWSVVALLWWGVRRAAEARPGVWVPLAMTGALAVDAWLLRAAGDGPDWRPAGVAAVALAFACLTASWRGAFVCGSGAVLLMTLAHTGLLLCGRSEAGLRAASFVLAWCAPLPLATVALPWFAGRRGAGAAVGVAGAALLGALAIWASVPV